MFLVLWHFQSPSEITRVIPHPVEDLFTVIVQPYSEDSAVRRSLVLHFKVGSKTPIATKALPFRLRAAAWNALDDSCRTLIAITTAWNVVECGESIREKEESGGTARKIDLSSSVPSKRNLFQDMFGKAAFEELTNGSFVTTVPSTSARNIESNTLLALFDKPAYMAPPIETMYESILSNLLETSKVSEAPLAVRQPDEPEEMMVDEESPADTCVYQRVVDDEELNALVDVFKRQNISRE